MDFPVTLVKGDRERTARTPVEFVNLRYDGYAVADPQPPAPAPADVPEFPAPPRRRRRPTA